MPESNQALGQTQSSSIPLSQPHPPGVALGDGELVDGDDGDAGGGGRGPDRLGQKIGAVLNLKLFMIDSL